MNTNQEKLDNVLDNYKQFHKIVYGNRNSNYKQDLRYRWFDSLKYQAHYEFKLFGVTLWKETLKDYYSRNYVIYGAHNHMYDNGLISEDDRDVLDHDLSKSTKWYNLLKMVKLEGDSTLGMCDAELLGFLLTFSDGSMVRKAESLDNRVKEAVK